MPGTRKKVLLTTTAVALVGAVLPLALDPERHDLDEKARAQEPGSFVELTQGKVHYELAGHGDGPVVVLIHGFSVPSFLWDPTFEALVAKGFRVLRYDLYGRGTSDRPDVRYDRTLYEEQLAELLGALRIDRPVDLVGLSMGGAVAACFTVRHPERVRRLVLIDPFVGPADAGLVTVPGLGDYFAVLFLEPVLMKRLRKVFYRPEKAPDWEGRIREQMRYRGFRRSLLRSLRDFMHEDLSGVYAEVGRLGKPTLLVWGREDRTVPFTEHERILGPLGAELLAVDEAGHTPHLERPEIVEAKLVEFLRGEGAALP